MEIYTKNRLFIDRFKFKKFWIFDESTRASWKNFDINPLFDCEIANFPPLVKH
jgi:hypothetical protein